MTIDPCEVKHRCLINLSFMYTVNHRKTWHFILDYNYYISCTICTLFAANETGINTLLWNYTFSKFTFALSIHYVVKSSANMKRLIQYVMTNFGVSHHNVLLFNNSNDSANFLQCLFTSCVQSVHPLHEHNDNYDNFGVLWKI